MTEPAAFAAQVATMAAGQQQQRTTDRATYRYLFCDLLTDRPIDAFPMTGVGFDRYITGKAGSCSGTINVPNGRIGARVEPIQEGRTALYVYRNGEIWWGGIVWTAKRSGDARGRCKLEISAATFDSYPERRTIRQTLSFNQVDQLAIERALWQAIQATPAGNIGVRLPAGLSGVKRDRTWLAGEGKSFGSAMVEVRDVEDGFESTIDVYEAAGQRVKQLRQGYPTITRPTTPPVPFSRPGQVESYGFDGDATRGGTSFQTRGENTGTNATEDVPPLLSDVAEATDLLATGWPQIDVDLSHGSVNQKPTLDAWARRYRDERAGSIIRPSLTVRPGSFEPGNLGDRILLRITDPLHPRRPDGRPGLVETRRVIGIAVTPPERGQAETHTLILEGVEDQ